MSSYGRGVFLLVFMTCHLWQGAAQNSLACTVHAPECDVNPGCAERGLKNGTCCPDENGTYAECCSDNALCVVHPSCVLLGLRDKCCPSEAGTCYECCNHTKTNRTWRMTGVVAFLSIAVLCFVSYRLYGSSSHPGKEVEPHPKLDKVLQDCWQDLPNFPLFGLGVPSCCNARLKSWGLVPASIPEDLYEAVEKCPTVERESGEGNEESVEQIQSQATLDFRGREKAYINAIRWIRAGVLFVWIPAPLLSLMTFLFSTCEQTGLPKTPWYIWLVMGACLVGKLICEAGALVYTLPWQILLTRRDKAGNRWAARFGRLIDFTQWRFFWWRTLMYLVSVLSTVSLFKNVMFFGTASALDFCFIGQTQGSSAFNNLWSERVEYSVIGLISNTLITRYPSFTGESWLLFVMTFLQPLVGGLLCLANERLCPKRAEEKTFSKHPRMFRPVIGGIDQYNSSIVGMLGDLAHMTSLTFWDANIAMRQQYAQEHRADEELASLNGNRQAFDQKEWIVSESRAGRFRGEFVDQVNFIIGRYSDVKHPDCPREIRYKAGSKTEVEIIGHDGDPHNEWRGSGKILKNGNPGRIVVNLSEKYGPDSSALEGTFTDIGIYWDVAGLPKNLVAGSEDWPDWPKADNWRLPHKGLSHVAQLDRQAVVLTTDRNFKETYEFQGKMGIVYGYDGIVQRVSGKGPAATTGIKAGQKIVIVNSHPFEYKRLADLEKSESAIKITVHCVTELVPVMEVDFAGTDFGENLVSRQMYRMFHKFFLAGVFQSQFFCHLQLDFLSLSRRTWEYIDYGVLLGIVLNLIVSAFRLNTAFEFYKLYRQYTSKTGTPWFRSGFLFFVGMVTFTASLAYCIAKLVGVYACPKPWSWTLFQGCLKNG